MLNRFILYSICDAASSYWDELVFWAYLTNKTKSIIQKSRDK